MASNKVVVLGPNGRRHTVKVNPNTTILQIIEESCQKLGYDPQQFDIKHHNKCLDTTCTIRFSGLPNNAQLELAEALKTRSESPVTIGLQLENGSRLLGEFLPGVSLWDILVNLCPNEAQTHEPPVIIYMRREICGVHSLQSTTLRVLGLTNGKAILRLLHRTPEQLHTQANISAPLPLKPVEEKPYVRTLKRVEYPNTTVSPTSEFPNKIHREEETPKKDDPFTAFIKQEKTKTKEPGEKKVSMGEVKPMEVDEVVPEMKQNTVEEEEFVFLGKRNALAFSQETARAVPSQDLPEDFFQLTINDAKKLLRDIKKRRMQMEAQPLLTAKLRSLEESKKQIHFLNKYKECIIRVYFPDSTVLQGTFKPVEKISDVMEFVREFLADPSLDFYLYTTPPKQILNPDSRLIETDCVPSAILYFGMRNLYEHDHYLKSNLVHQFISASMASLAAAQMRQRSTRNVAEDSGEQEDALEILAKIDNAVPSTSTRTAPTYEDYPARPPKAAEKVPKWFKPK